jgi:hypothetical protein
VTVVTNARAYYHTTRGCGRTKRPVFPAPSHWRVRNFLANLGHVGPRDRETVSAVVIDRESGRRRMKRCLRLIAVS